MYLPPGSTPPHPLLHLRSLNEDNPLYYRTPIGDQMSLSMTPQDLLRSGFI